jgi:membrane protease YdiL (CAAX protease family)
MDASGLTTFSALPLLPIAGLLWYVTGSSRRDVGLALGSAGSYGLAVVYPIIVLGTCALVSLGLGAADLREFHVGKTVANIALGAVATTIIAILTEEGFFRGALWASLPRRRLMFTSITFALWHISAVTLQTGFDLPAAQIPVFLANAAVMGAIWGVLREISGSLVASSVSHGVWNGLAYALFGYGTKVGALGIRHTAIYGPEVGLLGLALNALVLVAVVKTLNKPEPNANILYFSA